MYGYEPSNQLSTVTLSNAQMTVIFVAKYLASGTVSWSAVMGNAFVSSNAPTPCVVSVDSGGNV